MHASSEPNTAPYDTYRTLKVQTNEHALKGDGARDRVIVCSGVFADGIEKHTHAVPLFLYRVRLWAGRYHGKRGVG